jgi:hypothetical protein
METLSGLWLPILISAVLAFVASSLAWMVLPHHKREWKGLPDEAGTMAAIGKQSLPPGQYSFPFAADQKAKQEPAFQEKLKKGPAGYLVMLSPTAFNMGKTLGIWFVYLLVVSAFAGWVAGQALPAGAAYMSVFRVVAGVAFAAYALGRVQNSIWWGRPWSTTLSELADGAVYALLTAGTFGWLWPR